MSKNKKGNRKVKDLEKQYKKTFSKKTIAISIFSLICLIALISRIAYIMYVNGPKYKEAAYNQQILNRVISPKRGSILDANGKQLAISASVDTVSVNPNLIRAENKEKISKALSEIFELDYDSVAEKVNSTASFKTIIKKVEHDKITMLKEWMKENKISTGINIDNDSKRYYTYDNLASNLIGFCGTDNQGLYGIEYAFDDILTGTPGKVTTLKNSKAQEIPDANETFIPAQNGSDIVLTIDYNLQKIVEKYLEQGIKENKCTRGGNAILMNTTTGDIYAMATYPNYNLNSPFEPYTDSLKAIWDKLSSEEKTSRLNEVYRNRAISDGYEPGSTFKILTAAIALEEKITGTDIAKDFYCSGIYHVGDRDIRCWKPDGSHSYQTLREALEHSCNPAFMQLGARIGARTLYKYYRAFGLFEKSNTGLSGEAVGRFHDLNNMTSVDLATMSFGQRITITPLHLISAVAAIANDGVLMQPRIIKQIINTDTGVVTNIDPVEVRQVISKETSAKMRDLLHSVVLNGSGANADVQGYAIGGKSGTSEPLEANVDEGYVSSFVAISPIENTQIALLVTMYDPSNGKYHGGQVAAPVVAQILSEALPLLGIPSDSTTTQTKVNTKFLTDLKGKTFAEAKTIIENLGFKVKFGTDGSADELIVRDQTPKAGAALQEGAIVCLYDSTDASTRKMVTIPNLKGLSANEAKSRLNDVNLNISIEGSGVVISQTPSYDKQVEEGSIVKIMLKKPTTNTY